QNKQEIVRLLSQGDFNNSWFIEQLKSLKEWLEDESTFSLNQAMIFPVELLVRLLFPGRKLEEVE
ncbi:unnamed protein product, partial [marine sediment metagenome]